MRLGSPCRFRYALLHIVFHGKLTESLAQEQQEYIETTKDVGNQRLDFRFAY